MTESEPQSPSREALEQGYEPSDVNVRGLLIFVIIFVVGAVVIQAGLWGLLKFYNSLPRTADAVTSAAPIQERFPAPNLQPIEKHNQLPWQDLADLQHEKGMIFDALGWTIDPDTKEPRIPEQIVNSLAKDRAGSARHMPAFPSAPSPGTPGEGWGEGDLGFQGRWYSKSPSPLPSPGVPGEGVGDSPPQALTAQRGVNGLALRGDTAPTAVGAQQGGRP